MSPAPLPIFDGHNDTLLRLWRRELPTSSFFERGEEGHLDLPRAREGGFAGGLFACFVPSDSPDADLPHPSAAATRCRSRARPAASGRSRSWWLSPHGWSGWRAHRTGPWRSAAPAPTCAGPWRRAISRPCCTSKGPRRSTPGSRRWTCSTPRACARSGQSGAGRTCSATACRSASRARPTPGRG